ncbi:flavodoxin domain-containing protein [Salinirubellus sp. GCM10025818]|uniref:flavodoxin domain-containing protein n=1 Tax=Salinirubellus TaxID=2162630 RepID=UPI0030CB645B
MLYGTGEGQTAKIAATTSQRGHVAKIATTTSQRGHVAKIDVPDRPEPSTLEGYDAVVVGASVHVGKQQDAVRASLESRVPPVYPPTEGCDDSVDDDSFHIAAEHQQCCGTPQSKDGRR